MTTPGAPHAAPHPVIVVLAGPGDATDIFVNYLRARHPGVTVIMEGAQSRVTLARRRARRQGWVTVIGQVLFVVVAMPLLRRQGRQRRAQILRETGLDASPCRLDHHVTSINDQATVALLHDAQPAVVVVSGTRIISRKVLDSIECPVINVHAGITPQYRGVHGGYWALVESHPELVGTTVHLVDPGIDTGGVLARAYFEPTPGDSIATYPYLHLAAGLPALAEQVALVLGGGRPTPVPDDPDAVSRLFSHPALWAYLWNRVTRGIR